MHQFMPSVSLGRDTHREKKTPQFSQDFNVLDKRHLLKHLDCGKLGSSQVVPLVKNPPANAGSISDEGLIPGLGRSPGGGHGNPLQCSCPENPMDRRAGRLIVHRVTKSLTWLKQLSLHTSWGEYEIYSIKDLGCEKILTDWSHKPYLPK